MDEKRVYYRGLQTYFGKWSGDFRKCESTFREISFENSVAPTNNLLLIFLSVHGNYL